MPIGQEAAIRLAREALGHGAGARCWLVGSPDARRNDYYLVVLGAPDQSSGVATVDAVSGEITHLATLPAVRPHLEVDESRARSLAGAHDQDRTELIWFPSRISMSPLYPFWSVTLEDGKSVYVDQSGNVYTAVPEVTTMGGGEARSEAGEGGPVQ
jgi:hypothetical protein